MAGCLQKDCAVLHNVTAEGCAVLQGVTDCLLKDCAVLQGVTGCLQKDCAVLQDVTECLLKACAVLQDMTACLLKDCAVLPDVTTAGLMKERYSPAGCDYCRSAEGALQSCRM